MKHWPIFEPFEEAADSGRFLALWPSIIATETEELASGVPVEQEAPAGKVEGSLASPAVDAAGEVRPLLGPHRRRFPPLFLVLSLAAHATALALTAHFLIQPGVEAQTDAISVEIVVDASPNPNTDPSLAGEAARPVERVEPEAAAKTPQAEPEQAAHHPSPVAIQPEATKTHSTVAKAATAQEEPGDHAVVVPEPTFALPPSPPTIEAPKILATSQIAEMKVPAPALILPEEAPKIEPEQPAPTMAEIAKAVPAPALKLPDAAPEILGDTEPPVAVPVQAPLPGPAPDEPAPMQNAEKPVPAKKHVKLAPSEQKATEKRAPKRQATQPPEETRKAANRPSAAGVGNAAGRGSVASRGGASAGEKAAYAARLRSHVQRFERYPAAAERNGVTGSARIAITIDRAGRLISSRLAGSSGSAILDDAARATATRASPYPPPPDGIGGRTLTFAATVRFRR